MFDRWSESVEHCQLDCMLPGFTQLMWQCQKTTSPCSLGVPECGLHPAVLPSSHPPPRSALITPVCVCCSTIAPPSSRGVGCFMTWVTSTGFEGGRQSWCAHAHTYCHTVHFSLCSSRFLTSSHTHTHKTLHTLRRPPVVALATLRQIQTFPLKAEPKPTTIVCCWILRGAFRSCQFVQLRIKKTGWPT